MPGKTMSSRERMLAALNRDEPDHAPCSFMMYRALLTRCGDYTEFVRRQLELGLDTFVQLPPRPPLVVNDHYNLHGLPVSHAPQVEIQEWIERPSGEQWPILVKTYHTPAGTLRAEVRQTEDWRWGDHVPFLDDYIVPRSRKFLVDGPEDLAALAYLLAPPRADEIAEFHAASQPVLELAHTHDLLVAGGWGVGADLVGWVCGLENMVFATYDRPEFVQQMLDVIARWNRARMQVLLSAGIDLFIKRAWYENCDFWTPKTYRKFLFPILQADVELCHDRGVKFGYIITSNCMALLDMFVEAGVDVVIGVDPAAWDLDEARRKLAGKVCMWGGVNGHLTVEQGTATEVRAAVREAMHVLAPGGGFILSPVDNVREDTPRARANVQALIAEWRAGGVTPPVRAGDRERGPNSA